MVRLTFVFILASITTVLAYCDTERTGPAPMLKARLLTELEEESSSLEGRDVAAKKLINVQVRWNVITNGTEGLYARSVADKAIKRLNAGHNPSGFNYTIASFKRTNNADWFTYAIISRSTYTTEMKNKLHQGDAKVLNVYTVDMPSSLSGFTTFPEDYKSSPKKDGIVLDYKTLPVIGTRKNLSNGGVFVHEAGHWFGLSHPFIGDDPCSTDPTAGDGIADTPPQSKPTGYDSCPVGKQDTCPDAPGKDDVTNFMNFAPDSCANHFTPGQTKLMLAMAKQYRGLK